MRPLILLGVVAAVVALAVVVSIGLAPSFAPGPENRPPKAVFSWFPDQPAINQSVTLDASESRDVDGWIARYEWDFGNEGTASEAGPRVTHTFAAGGTYRVFLRVIDNLGAQGDFDHEMEIGPNEAPVASFMWAVIQMRWEFGDGTTVTSTGPTARHTFVEVASYVVHLTVVDSDGAFSKTSHRVEVVSELPFETVAKSWWGYWDTPNAFTITNQSRWDHVWWEAVGVRTYPPDPAPVVDFENSTVIAALMGSRRNCCAFEVAITEVLQTPDGLEVALRFCECPDAALAETHPYHFVTVAGTWPRATFVTDHLSLYDLDVAQFTFGSKRPAYMRGEEIQFLVRNDAKSDLVLPAGGQWAVYMAEGDGWVSVATASLSDDDIILRPAELFTWTWAPSDSTGFYRVELVLEHPWDPFEQVQSFFWIL
jgi:hypothetical protein